MAEQQPQQAFISILGIMLLMLGLAETSIYLYTRYFVSVSLFKTHCWLCAGIFTVFSLLLVFIFLFRGTKTRRDPGCFLFAHFVALSAVQVASWTVAELIEWRLWWTEDIAHRNTRQTYIRIYILTTMWSATTISLSNLAAFICCVNYTCLSNQNGKESGLFNVTRGKSSGSWQFLRVRSSTPKDRKRRRKSVSPRNCRQLKFDVDIFAGHSPLTPIAPHRPIPRFKDQDSSTLSKSTCPFNNRPNGGYSTYLTVWNQSQQNKKSTVQPIKPENVPASHLPTNTSTESPAIYSYNMGII